MEKINFSAKQISIMDSEQNASFYWDIKKKCIQYCIDRFSNNRCTVLDIGCGTGYVLSGSNINPEKYVGMDAFIESEKFLKQNFSPLIEFTTSPINQFRKQKFDTILLLDVLEHIENESAFLDELLERMDKNSHLIISVPAHQWLYSDADVIAGHVRRYSTKSLLKLFESKGFVNLFSSSFLTTTLPLLVLSRLFFSKINRDGINEQNNFTNYVLKKLTPLDFFIFHKLKLSFGGTIVAVFQKK